MTTQAKAAKWTRVAKWKHRWIAPNGDRYTLEQYRDFWRLYINGQKIQLYAPLSWAKQAAETRYYQTVATS